MRKTWQFWLPSVILLSFGLFCKYLVYTHGLSPWKGGSFGMFAVTDRFELRSVRAWAITPSGEYRLKIPKRLSQRVRVLRMVASRSNANHFANDIAQLLRADDRHITGLRVAVYTIRYGDGFITSYPIVEQNLWK